MEYLDDKNTELITLIWVDKHVDSTEENRQIQIKLRSLVNYLRVFDNCQECEDFILNGIDLKYDKIILIVSGQFGKDIIQNIHQLKQIVSIFVFCGDKQKNELWANQYHKIKNVIVEIDELLNEIENDIKSNEQKINERIDLIVNNKNNILFIILQIESNIIDKRYFLNYCFNYYKNNLKQIKYIQDFEHLYLSINCLDYLFNKTFIYNLLIKSLITSNILFIYLLRFYLKDIENELFNCSSILIQLYKGQLMTIDQIDLINNLNNLNKLFYFNSYLFLNKNKEDILNSLNSFQNLNGLHKVLFIFNSNQSAKIYKQFIIYPILTSFKIISIKFINRIWFIHLDVFNLKQINKLLKPIDLPNYLNKISLFDQSEKLYYLLLEQYPKLKSKCYNGLGKIAQNKCLYNLSLDYYLKSLENATSKDYPHYLNNIGCIYDYLKDYNQSLKYYFQSLSFIKSDKYKSMYLNNIGITYSNINDYNQAIKYFQDCLSLQKKCLSQNDYHFGITYNNIGLYYFNIQQFNKSLEYFNLSLKYFKLNYYKGIVYQNLAQLFENTNQLNNALEYYQQSLDIFQKFKPIDHPNILFIQQQIQLLKQ